MQAGASDIFIPRSSTVTGSIDAGRDLPASLNSVFLDLRAVEGPVNVEFTVDREAALDNLVGFYHVGDENGGIDIDGNGSIDLLPGEAGYATGAIASAVPDLGLTTPDQTTSIYQVELAGGRLFAPYIIPNGNANDVADLHPAFFAFPMANPDGFEHIRFDSGHIVFEDLLNGGDQDFNDMVIGVQYLA